MLTISTDVNSDFIKKDPEDDNFQVFIFKLRINDQKPTVIIEEPYVNSGSTTDPDGDQLYYLFDWDAGSDSGWVGPKNSGETASRLHT